MAIDIINPVFLGLTCHHVVCAAADYGRAIAAADTTDQLAEIKAALEESVDALLAQEQVLIHKRELLETAAEAALRG